MKVITKDTIQDNFAIILELTDTELAFIEEHPESFLGSDLALMQKLMASRGHNAHIVQLTLNDDINIAHYIKILLKRYESVSWFNREHQFHIRHNARALMN